MIFFLISDDLLRKITSNPIPKRNIQHFYTHLPTTIAKLVDNSNFTKVCFLDIYNDTVFIPSSRTLLGCEWHPLILLASRDWLIPPWLTDRTWLSLVAIAVPLLPRVPSSVVAPPFLWSLLSFSYSSSLPSRIPPCSPGRLSRALCWDGLVKGRLCIFLGRLRFRVGTTNCEEYRPNFLHTRETNNKSMLITPHEKRKLIAMQLQMPSLQILKEI